MAEEPIIPVPHVQQPITQTKLDVFERVAKIVSLAAIPIVIPIALAFYSAQVQENSQKETINRDYVQLAVSILKEKKEDSNAQLRDWAVDLLTEHSPTKFAPNVVNALKTGAVSLPGLLGTSRNQNLAAISPDGKILATSDDRSYALWDVVKNQRIMVADTVTTVTALEFSPDSLNPAVGFSNGDVSITSVADHNTVITLRTKDPVAAIKFTNWRPFQPKRYFFTIHL